MEYSIQEVAKAAGTTSRTLRYYDEVGLVRPSRVGSNGYRFYDDRALVRLQRVLLLRELGLGLAAIGEVLEAQDARRGEDSNAVEAEILSQHLELLQREKQRIDAQIGSLTRTVIALRSMKPLGTRSTRQSADERKVHTNEGGLMSENIFEGFDHTQYREEVEERWGADAYAKSDRWWRSLGEDGQQEWQQRLAELNDDWRRAALAGEDPAAASAQDLARRHVEWLRAVPHTPASTGGDLFGYVLGLAEMYVSDERFAANYGGIVGAKFVRDALRIYVEGDKG